MLKTLLTAALFHTIAYIHNTAKNSYNTMTDTAADTTRTLPPNTTAFHYKGSKQAIAHKIIPLFPPHDVYIEPFFGAGGMYFCKRLAKYNIVNDKDSDIYNFFTVLKESPALLKDEIANTLYCKEQLTKKVTRPLERAVKFFFQHSCTLYAGGATLTFQNAQPRESALAKIDKLKDYCLRLQINNVSYDDFLRSVTIKSNADKTLVYCDPPYVGTNAYHSGFWEIEDFTNLLTQLNLFAKKFKAKFAISEFDTEEVVAASEAAGLVVSDIGERRNIKNVRNEVLITNYNPRVAPKLF